MTVKLTRMPTELNEAHATKTAHLEQLKFELEIGKAKSL